MVAVVAQKSSGIDRKSELAEVVLGIVDRGGLDSVSVREVAAAAGVSIGAVQHHFSTKDELLAFAFRHVVERTRRRVMALSFGPLVADNVRLLLRELLPLDDERRVEGRLYVAFAARAAVTPSLALIQAASQRRIRDGLRDALARHAGPAVDADPDRDADLLLALADGLTFDAVSDPERFTAAQLDELLDRAVTRVLG